MGVLVSSGDFKVVIDGLFCKPNPVYHVPTSETLESIMKGEAPFDGVDLALVTHNHSDHFDAALDQRILEQRKRIKKLTLKQRRKTYRKYLAEMKCLS